MTTENAISRTLWGVETSRGFSRSGAISVAVVQVSVHRFFTLVCFLLLLLPINVCWFLHVHLLCCRWKKILSYHSFLLNFLWFFIWTFCSKTGTCPLFLPWNMEIALQICRFGKFNPNFQTMWRPSPNCIQESLGKTFFVENPLVKQSLSRIFC